MKRLTIMIALMLLTAACACAESNILVACFSVTGNTASIAELTAEMLDADYYEIVPENPYTDADIQYTNSTCRANLEQDDQTCRPAIAGLPIDMNRYDTVLIAYPIWWGQEPRIIDTFMETYDLTDKALATFCTSGSSGIETAERNLHDFAPDSHWMGAKRFPAGTDGADIRTWLNELAIPFDEDEENDVMMKLEIGNSILYAEFADTDAARTLRDKLSAGSITIDVNNYGGWEKVGNLPWSLPADDEQITAQQGDIMLYTGNSIVLFYGSNSWSYTRLGRIVDSTSDILNKAFGGSESRLTISLSE